jgi:hypothetical protein
MIATRRQIATALIAVLMLVFGAGVSPVQAQNENAQAGLVNVNVQVTEVIDDVTVVVKDINVAVAAAANILANVCGNNIGVAALIAALAQTGSYGPCTNDATGQTLTLTQN